MGSIVDLGDKLHIMTRRLFEEDLRRHFVGKVTKAEDLLVEARGYTFIYQPGTNDYRRLPEERTRIFAIGDAGHVVNKLPRSVDLGSISYRTMEGRVVLTDGGDFSLPINEFGSSR